MQNFPFAKSVPAFMTNPGRYHQVPEIVVEEQQKKPLLCNYNFFAPAICRQAGPKESQDHP